MGLDIVLYKVKGVDSLINDDSSIIDDNGNIVKYYEEVGDWYKCNFVYDFFLKHIDTDNMYNYVDDNTIDLLISYIKNDLKYIESLCYIDDILNEDISENIEKYIDVDKLYLNTRSGFFFGSIKYDKYHVMNLKEVLSYLINSKEIEGKYYYHYSY